VWADLEGDLVVPPLVARRVGHDGTTLLAVSGRLFLHDAGSGKLRQPWPGSEHAFGGLALEAGGRRLATAHVIPRPWTPATLPADSD
jgi:hypothetical protein